MDAGILLQVAGAETAKECWYGSRKKRVAVTANFRYLQIPPRLLTNSITCKFSDPVFPNIRSCRFYLVHSNTVHNIQHFGEHADLQLAF